EILLFAADEIPETQTAADTLGFLLTPEGRDQESPPREQFSLIQQAHFGARDLRFGPRAYRPRHAGYNGRDDVARLADYLAAVDPGQWQVADLAGMRDAPDEAERQEELEFAGQCLEALATIYRQAGEHGQVVVCEVL